MLKITTRRRAASKTWLFSEEIHVKKYMTLHGESGTCLVHCAIFLRRKMCLAFEGKDFPILKLVLRRTHLLLMAQ